MSQPGAIPLNVVGRTDVGKKRQRNEDSLRWLMPEPGSPEARFGGLFVVCDGMGGVGKGDIASQTAIEAIFKVYFDLQNGEMDTQKRLKGAIQAAHEAVREKAAQLGMMYIGTTSAGLAVTPQGQAVEFNLGDSRVYRFRDQKLTQVSKDQSVVAAQLEAGEITPEQAREARNMNITAFIGHPFELEIAMGPVDFRAGDLFLMCSDGLWDIVHDEELEAILKRSSAQAALDEFISTTLRRGAPDNVTAIIVSSRQERSSRPGWLIPLIGLILIAAVAAGLVFSGVIPLPSGAGNEPDDPQGGTTGVAMIASPSNGASVLLLPSDTATVTDTASPSATASRTPAATNTPPPTPTQTETATVTSSPTRRPSRTPTGKPSETATQTSSPTASASPTRTVSLTRTPSATASPTETVSPTATASATDTASPPPSATATPEPSATPTRRPTETATPRPTNTATVPPTTTLNATALANLGTPAAALELLVVLPFDIAFNQPSAVTPVAVYRGDLEILEGRVRANPIDLGSRYQLMKLLPGIRSDGMFWWLLEEVEPSLVVIDPGGIIVRGMPSFTAAQIGAIAVGERIRVVGIDPGGRWYAVRGIRFTTGWVNTTLERDGLIRFEGDPADVQVVQPPRPTPDGTAATPADGETPEPTIEPTPES